MSPRSHLVFALVTFCFSFGIAKADQLAVDPLFGLGGVVRDGALAPVAATLQPDGKLLVRGLDAGAQVVLVRLNRDGTRDHSFGTSGLVSVGWSGRRLSGFGNVVVSPTGDILLAGVATQGVVVRLLPNGSLDTAFGAGGGATLTGGTVTNTIKLALRSDGGMMALSNGSTGGFFPRFFAALEHLDAAGTRDASWDLPCIGSTFPRNVDIVVQTDDKPLIEIDDGYTQCLARFTTGGTLDASFGSAGVAQRPINSTNGAGLVLDPQDPLGRIDVWVAQAIDAGTLTRLLQDGTVDPAFAANAGNQLTLGGYTAPALGCAGKIVNVYDFGVQPGPDVRFVRYNSDGSADATFATDGSGQLTEHLADALNIAVVLVRDDGDVLIVGNSAISSTPLAIVAAYRQQDCARPFDPLSVSVLEYYNASLDHYFITASTDDMTALDSGRFAGWARTGRTFAASSPVTGAAPVCRFYIPPAFGDSHFFSASSAECSGVAARFPQFILETPDAMRMGLPDPNTGACAAPTPTPVFRVWDGRADTNHRYTTDVNLRNAMVASGWIPEGYGPDAVAMCARLQYSASSPTRLKPRRARPSAARVACPTRTSTAQYRLQSSAGSSRSISPSRRSR